MALAEARGASFSPECLELYVAVLGGFDVADLRTAVLILATEESASFGKLPELGVIVAKTKAAKKERLAVPFVPCGSCERGWIGARVQLVNCPHGEPGIVRAFSRGRAEVEWPDLNMTSRHKPERLRVVEAFRNQFVSEHEKGVPADVRHHGFTGMPVPGILERDSERGSSLTPAQFQGVAP